MARLISGVRNLFHRYPFVTNSAIYGSLYVGAEYSQQFASKRWLAVSKIIYRHSCAEYELGDISEGDLAISNPIYLPRRRRASLRISIMQQ